ncbi:MAG: hypothetical protein AAB417_03340 [Patescibacteria group bacterium]
MLSGKRQHWVGLSKKSRKALERFPFKDFAILVLIAIIVTMAWTWYDSTPRLVHDFMRGNLPDLSEEMRIRKERGLVDLPDEILQEQMRDMQSLREEKDMVQPSTSKLDVDMRTSQRLYERTLSKP